MTNWDEIEHFEQGEFDDPDHPESGELIDETLVLTLDQLRDTTGWALIPHWNVGGCVDVYGTHGHDDNSYHRADNGCSACDFHFDTDAHTRLQFYAVEKIGFSGVGIYW